MEVAMHVNYYYRHVDFYILAHTLSMLRLHGMEWTLDEMSDIKQEMNRYLRNANG